MSKQGRRDYLIQFAGKALPTAEAWRKFEVAVAAIEIIDRFNRNHPALATDLTRDVVERVRRRLKEVEIVMPPTPEQEAEISATINELLEQHSPEEAKQILHRQHGEDLSLHQLVSLCDPGRYRRSLQRDADQMTSQRISYEQMAVLWNESGRPAPGAPFWTASLVEALFSE